jgi:hypothetical protein
MKTLIPVIILLFLSGCAVGGIQCKVEGDTATFTPTERHGIFKYILPNNLPSGNYKIKKLPDGGVEASADTKIDVKFFDFNFAKLGE